MVDMEMRRRMTSWVDPALRIMINTEACAANSTDRSIGVGRRIIPKTSNKATRARRLRRKAKAMGRKHHKREKRKQTLIDP